MDKDRGSCCSANNRFVPGARSLNDYLIDDPSRECVIVSLLFSYLLFHANVYLPNTTESELYQNYTFINANSRTYQNIMTILPSTALTCYAYFLQLHDHSSLSHTAPAHHTKTHVRDSNVYTKASL